LPRLINFQRLINYIVFRLFNAYDTLLLLILYTIRFFLFMLLFVFPKVVVSWKLPKICTYFYFSHCSKSKYKKVLPISTNIFKPDKKQQKSQEPTFTLSIL
jgi:hypothetical protein